MTGAVGVVVLGMSRSGTSAVTRMFVSAGFFAGHDEDLMPATDQSPSGHWENVGVWRANEQILDRLQATWFDPPATALQRPAREWAVPMLRTEVERILGQADGAPVAIKDPRIGVMTPLWGEILTDQLHPVLVIRDPIEIAHSVARRDGTPPAFALAAWELHMVSLLDYLTGRTATVAPYGSMMQDIELAQLVVEQATAHLESARASRVQPADGKGALNRSYHRNRAGVGDHDEQLTARQLELWRLLSSLPAGDCAIEAPAELRKPGRATRAAVQRESERLRLARELAAERERSAVLASRLAEEKSSVADLSTELSAERERVSAARAAQLHTEDTLSDIQASLSWRITKPLRAANRALRRVTSRDRSSRPLKRRARSDVDPDPG